MSDVTDVFRLVKPQGEIVNPHVMEHVPEPALIPPLPRNPQQRAAAFVLENGWFVIVFPDSDMHWALAEKLAKAKPGEMVPLSHNEMALLTEFTPWPKLPHTGSF